MRGEESSLYSAKLMLLQCIVNNFQFDILAPFPAPSAEAHVSERHGGGGGKLVTGVCRLFILAAFAKC